MTDSDYDIVELPDEEGTVYLVGVDGRTTPRMLDRIQERFDSLFENAEFIAFTADIVAEGDLEIHRFDSEDIKESLEDFEEAEDAGEQMVAIRKMREEHDG